MFRRLVLLATVPIWGCNGAVTKEGETPVLTKPVPSVVTSKNLGDKTYSSVYNETGKHFWATTRAFKKFSAMIRNEMAEEGMDAERVRGRAVRIYELSIGECDDILDSLNKAVPPANAKEVHSLSIQIVELYRKVYEFGLNVLEEGQTPTTKTIRERELLSENPNVFDEAEEALSQKLDRAINAYNDSQGKRLNHAIAQASLDD